MPISPISSLSILFLISLSLVGCNSSSLKPLNVPPDPAPIIGSKTVISLPAPKEEKSPRAKKAQPAPEATGPASAMAPPGSPASSGELTAKSLSNTDNTHSKCADGDCDDGENNSQCKCDNEQICDPSKDCDRHFCPHPRCCVNSDCPLGEVCIAYDCMPCTTMLCGKTCCASNYLCIDDECVCPGKVCAGICDPAAQCCLSADCPTGSTCSTNRQCVVCAGKICTPGICTAGAACCINADCPANSICTANQCVACTGRVCFGACIANATCCLNSDCPSNICTLNQCVP